MKKTTFLTGLITISSVAALVAYATPASAKDFNGESDGRVEFEGGSIVKPPITPPIDPPIVDPDPDFGLLYVPKEFNFKKTAVPATPTALVIALDPTNETSTGSNPATKHVGLGDVRGTRVGWKLQASFGEMSEATSSRKITGATISMTQAVKEITNPTTNTIGAVVSTADQPDTVTTALTIGATDTLVMSASAGKGQGYWAGELTDIELNVPATASLTAGDKYTGTVNWVLTDSL